MMLDICPNGHAWTLETERWYRGRHICLVCHRERVTRWRRSKGVRSWAEIVASRTHCRNGHRYTPWTIYHHSGDGGRRCLLCHQAQSSRARVRGRR